MMGSYGLGETEAVTAFREERERIPDEFYLTPAIMISERWRGRDREGRSLVARFA